MPSSRAVVEEEAIFKQEKLLSTGKTHQADQKKN